MRLVLNLTWVFAFREKVEIKARAPVAAGSWAALYSDGRHQVAHDATRLGGKASPSSLSTFFSAAGNPLFVFFEPCRFAVPVQASLAWRLGSGEGLFSVLSINVRQ